MCSNSSVFIYIKIVFSYFVLCIYTVPFKSLGSVKICFKLMNALIHQGCIKLVKSGAL